MIQSKLAKSVKRGIVEQLASKLNPEIVSLVLNSYDLDSYLLDDFVAKISKEVETVATLLGSL